MKKNKKHIHIRLYLNYICTHITKEQREFLMYTAIDFFSASVFLTIVSITIKNLIEIWR